MAVSSQFFGSICRQWVGRLCAVALGATVAAAQGAPAIQDLTEISTAVRAFVVEQNGGVGSPDDVEVGLIDPRLRLARCGQPLHRFFAPGSQATGNTTVGVRCLGPATWLIYVPVRVKLFREVVVTTRALPRKSLISREDIQLVRRDVSGQTQGYLEDPTAAIGRVVRRPLALGTVVDPGALDQQRLVRRGEKVLIKAKMGGLRVQMTGKALMSGAAGERVKVKNLSSGRIVEGTVAAAGIVVVQP